jgi:hypothetical protein
MGLDETPVFFPPNTAIAYEGGLRSVEPDHLHIPKARNQVALDSFFQIGSIFYIFRFAEAKKHDIKKGIKASLSKLVLPPKTDWKLVFITPPGCEVDINATSEVDKFLEGVRVYTADLEIK